MRSPEAYNDHYKETTMQYPPAEAISPGFTERERHALVTPRERYRTGSGLDTREHERLRFVRWLVETGRLTS